MNDLGKHGSPTALVGDESVRFRIEAHHSRVAALSRFLALQMGLGPSQASLIADAAALHDIGKLFVSVSYLHKPGALNEDEWEIVRQHPVWGHAMLSPCQHPSLRLAAMVALQHHENWDGSGYPHGLSGEDIAIESRIVSICDVYDALRDDRPYRSGISHDEAVRVIERGDGRTHPTMFDPAVLQAFSQCHSSLGKLYAKNSL